MSRRNGKIQDDRVFICVQPHYLWFERRLPRAGDSVIIEKSLLSSEGEKLQKGRRADMANMEDVARAAHVSRATVSRVLSNHPSVKPETRRQVMEWVHKLNYEPNQVAQNLAGQRTNLIGVLFSDLSNPLYASLSTALVREAERQGYSVILGDAQRESAREANIITSFKRRKVDGIIVRAIGKPNEKLYGRLSVPMVSLYKIIGRKNIISSSEDGGAQVARHFCSTGRTRVGYLGPTSSQYGNDKLAGLQSGLDACGLKIAKILDCNQHETAENQKAYQIFSRYLEENDPRAINAWFAHSDIAASDIIRALMEHGVRVPGDVSVCGYNDTLLARKMIPSVSSVASPIDEIARMAIELLIRAIEHDNEPETVCLTPHLVVRESSIVSFDKIAP